MTAPPTGADARRAASAGPGSLPAPPGPAGRIPAAPPRLLIVSHCFPPSEMVGGRRPAALARIAVRSGWDVRVLTATPSDRNVAGIGIPEWQVVRAAPLFHWPQLGAGSRPVRDGDGTPRARPAPLRPALLRPALLRPALLRPAGLRSAATRSAKFLGREALMFPDGESTWIVPAVTGFLRAQRSWRPDVIFATGPPFSGFVVAAALARKLGAPWVADYRDLWTVGNEYRVPSRVALRRRADHWLERRLLRSVARCVTISAPIAQTLRATFRVDTEVVMNGIDRRAEPAVSSPGAAGTCWPAGATGPQSLRLAHTGLLYPGKRSPGPLLDAIALLGDEARRVHFVQAGPDNGVAVDAAGRSAVPEAVTVLGHVPAERSWRIQAEADVLVLLMWNDPRDAGTVPGKFFDYLHARRPILMIGHRDGVVAELIRARGAGVVLSDPAEIAEQLRRWLAVKDRDGRIPALPAAVQQGLFREDQMARYLELLRDTGARHRARPA
ncbi:glycosyltransferase [Plantactinospora sp. WMMB334]|uniref:glycosyltransferase n=1 Tax=Plantactinospora sp. WMMB334 TaxID=3404119 RepID=UPI003B954AF0